MRIKKLYLKDNRNCHLSGQSLFEVVLALGLIAMIIVTVVSLASVSIRNSSFSRYKSLATRYSQETLEWLRGERDSGWTTFVTHAQTPTFCFPSLSWALAKVGVCGADDKISGTPLKREIGFTIIDLENIETSVKVYWTDAQGYHESKSVTDFTNWRTN